MDKIIKENVLVLVYQSILPPKPSGKPANFEEMMKTFEETEKICEIHEKKDKERRDRDAVEN